MNHCNDSSPACKCHPTDSSPVVKPLDHLRLAPCVCLAPCVRLAPCMLHACEYTFISPSLHGLMVNVDTWHTGVPGFDSLWRHFFTNLTQHLALPETPAGQTVRHHLCTSTNQWMNHLKSGGPSILVDKHYRGQFRKVVHPCWTNSLVDNPEVDETTMNRFLLTSIYLIFFGFHMTRRPLWRPLELLEVGLRIPRTHPCMFAQFSRESFMRFQNV